MKNLIVILVLFALVGCAGGGSSPTTSGAPKDYTDDGNVITFLNPTGNVYIKEIHYGGTADLDKIVVRVEDATTISNVGLLFKDVNGAFPTNFSNADYVFWTKTGTNSFPNFYLAGPASDQLDKNDPLSKIDFEIDSVIQKTYWMKDF